MSEHTLTEHERKLLEDCPREARYFGTVEQADHLRDATKMVHDDQSGDATEDEVGEDEGPWRIVQNEEFFDVTKDPADQDAWFATFDIERYGRAEALSAARAEAARLNAKHHEEQAADHIGEPNELTKAKEADMQDGPWRVNKDQDAFQLWSHNIHGMVLAAWVVHPEAYTEPEARALAEAEASRLNAKWREEQMRELLAPFEHAGCRITNSWSPTLCRRDWYANHLASGVGNTYFQPDSDIKAARENIKACAEILDRRWREEQEAKEREAEKQRRIEAFVKTYQDSNGWFWVEPWKKQHVLYIDRLGICYLWKDAPANSEQYPRAELEAALRAAGVEEPVTISDELRARLEKRWDVAISVFLPFVDEILVDEDGNSNPNNGHRFTRQQARAFLREKGIEVPND